MSEDYKKIAFEDVKKGQRVRVVERCRSHIATYEGVVFRTNPEWSEIDLGEEGDEATVSVGRGTDIDILLLEDAQKPKVVRTEKVTIEHYDDGTKTETTTESIPMRIETVEQFEAYEGYLKMILKDDAGDYWMYRNGVWVQGSKSELSGVKWRVPMFSPVSDHKLPMTIVKNVED